MKRGGLGILIFLIVALLVAFLALKQMQNPKPLSERVSEQFQEATQQAAQQAVNSVNEAMQNIDFDEIVQNSGLADTIQDALSQIGANG